MVRQVKVLTHSFWLDILNIYLFFLYYSFFLESLSLSFFIYLIILIINAFQMLFHYFILLLISPSLFKKFELSFHTFKLMKIHLIQVQWVEVKDDLFCCKHSQLYSLDKKGTLKRKNYKFDHVSPLGWLYSNF